MKTVMCIRDILCTLILQDLPAGFLSWSRNAAICAGVGATLTMTDRLSYLSFGMYGTEKLQHDIIVQLLYKLCLFICLKKWPKLPFRQWTIVHGGQKIESAQKIHASRG